jgi:predicted  nucleic acid-binding Zn-ribbon protein
MQWDIAIRERNTYMDYLTKIQLQHEEEINKGMASRMKSSKDLKRLTEERNAAMEEYSLVMRERDSVHKEIEKLQDDLLQSNKKLKTLEIKSNEIHDEKKMLLYEVESLRREIKSSLDDRDNALKVSFSNMFNTPFHTLCVYLNCFIGVASHARKVRRIPRTTME